MIGNTIQRTHAAVGACEGESEGEAVGAFKGEALVAFEKMETLSIGSLVVQLRRAQIDDWRWWRSKRTPPTRARNLRLSLQSRPGIQLSLFLIFTTKINDSFSQCVTGGLEISICCRCATVCNNFHQGMLLFSFLRTSAVKIGNLIGFHSHLRALLPREISLIIHLSR
mmetsp:Transcript_8713/g.12108  ORF Transcript_8713/g.12108 Transcript_8713/m.12108 type:complete len:168 (-) Transcript_8713:84-587(-)